MARQAVAVPIDLLGNELRNFAIHRLAAAPGTPVLGQFYFNTSTNVGYIWNGAAWRPVDVSAASAGSIPMAALATDPLARANHSGSQVAATISDLATTVQAYPLNVFAVPTGALNMNGKEITNALNPTAAQSVATKAYVDSAAAAAAQGLDAKPSCRLATTANITLSGVQTVDGVAGAAGDRILVPKQTTTTQNGVYVMAAGAWARATDADTTGEITPGAHWYVEEGTVNGKRSFVCANTGAITIGTTAISIVAFSAINDYEAGNGVTLTDNVLAVQAAASGGIAVAASGVSIDLTVGVIKKAYAIAGTGSATAFTITHSTGRKAVDLVLTDNGTTEAVGVDWVNTDVNTVTVTFGIAPPTTGFLSACTATLQF